MSPTRVEWPLQLPNAPSRNVPITVRAGSTDVSMGIVTLTPGLDPEGAGTAFKITNNTCPATLTAGSTCAITTSFNPLEAGAYTGDLLIGGAGVAHVVRLSGLTTDGFSGWQQATVAPDESSANKMSLTPFTPATFDATGNAGSLTLQGHSGADDLSITVAPPAGQQLTAGATYTGAVPAPGAGSGLAQLSLAVNGQNCPISTGSFAVHNIQVDPGTGTIQRASITFKRTCSLDRAARAQVGSVGFNALRGPRTVPSFGELDGVQGTVVTTQVSPQRTDFGSSVYVAGRLAPPGGNGLKGKRVYLWQKRADSGAWDKVARTRTGFDGAFSFTRFAARNVNYRTDFGGTDYLLPSTSEPVDLKVQRHVVAALSANSIAVNAPVLLFGHIEVREAGVGMEVQRENRQGKWATIATGSTGGRGQFAIDLTFDRRKVVNLRVRSAATLVCELGQSSSLSLTVD